MTILYRLRALLRWLFRRDEIERALDRDLEDYIEHSAAEKMRAGMSEAEARRAARIELGGVEQTKERVRSTLSLGLVERVIADAGYALRTLRRQKTFMVVTVLTLALGIGANVAIFSLAEPILLRSLPVPEPDRLVNLNDPGPKTIGRMDPERLPYVVRESDNGGTYNVFSYPMFRDLERAQEPFAGLAAHQTTGVAISTGEQTQNGSAILVSGSYFSVLGVQPALGRLLGPQDDQVDGLAESVVLSHAYWQSAFASDPGVAGRELNDTDDRSVAIVSQRFTERFGLTRDDVLGRTINLGLGFGSAEIVGVVADFRSGRISEEIEPRVYRAGTGNEFYVQSARPPEDLMSAIQDTVARIDPRMGIAGFQTMEQQFLDSIAIERFAAGAASAFAVLATALAALGLYGVLAYSVDGELEGTGTTTGLPGDLDGMTPFTATRVE